MEQIALVTFCGLPKQPPPLYSGVPQENVSTAEQLRIERRSGHRFEQYQVPVILRAPDGQFGNGFTLNLSSRGALVRTDFLMTAGQSVEITLTMPSEISMVENGSVRCRARVLRLHTVSDHGQPVVALRIEHYEFLPREVTPVHLHAPAPVHVSQV